MEVTLVFAIIAGIIFLGYIGEYLFKKTNIPDVLLLIIVGIIIGELGIAGSESFGFSATLFTTFALIFILFQGALNIDIKTTISSLSRGFELSFLNFFVNVGIVGIIAYLLGFDIWVALLVGSILGGTSSAIVIPLIKNLPVNQKNGFILTLESAISDVLCIIGAITILEIMQGEKVVPHIIISSVLSSFALAIILGILVGLLWIILMNRHEILTRSYMMTIGVVIALYSFVESPFVGASGAISALAFGLIVGNGRVLLSFNKKKHKLKHMDGSVEMTDSSNILLPSAKSFYSEIFFFVKTFFFVYLGIMIDISNLIILFYGFFIALGVFLVRPIVIWLVFGKDRTDIIQRVYLETIIPKGLAPAILAGIAVQSGLLGINESIFVNLIFSVIFFTILISSILLFFTQRQLFNGFFPFLHPNRNLGKR